MVTDPEAAETHFRKRDTFESRMYLILLLGTHFADRPGAQEEIGKIAGELDEKLIEAGGTQRFFQFASRVVRPIDPYDGCNYFIF